MSGESIGVARLSERERERLKAAHPELRGGEPALVISAPRPVLSAIEEIAHRLAWENEQSERILQAVAGEGGAGVLDEPRLLQLHRQAEARDGFLREFTTLTSAEVAELSGSTARNTSALASRWKAEGKVFSVSVGRADRFAVFQFGDDGKPLPAVGEVVRILEGRSGWTLALWFAAPSGWLDGRRPADVLATDPAAVVEAARRAVAPLDV